jgi:hypothetical protein
VYPILRLHEQKIGLWVTRSAIFFKAKKFKRWCLQHYFNWRARRFFNTRSKRSARRILFARESEEKYFYDTLLDWIPRHWPEAAKWIELQPLPCADVDWSRVGAFHAWVHDPVRERSPETYAEAQDAEEQCRQFGIPVTNPVDVLSNGVRSRMLSLIAGPGIRVPRLVDIDDWDEFTKGLGGLSLPIIVRPAWGHGKAMHLIRDRRDLTDDVRTAFEKPIAVEFIDIRSDDNLHRKYRYVMIGDTGIPRHMLASYDWKTDGESYVEKPAIRAEERAYIERPDPHHALLNAARRRLGFDIVAFDYGLDRSGALVVWEANPFPDLSYAENPIFPYKLPMADHVCRTLLTFHFERAGIPLPDG